MTAEMHQRLPRSGTDREALREKGQFWTPDWVAEAMVAFVLDNGATHVFDPAVGAGAFFRAARTVAARSGKSVSLLGTEIHHGALVEAEAQGLTRGDLRGVEVRDFIRNPPTGPFDAIVANPPYIRHHRLPLDLKAELRALSTRMLGRPLDGRAGLHVYFLLRALERLAPAGRLAFILPADTAEGVFASTLWSWLTRRYRLHAVVTFERDATPFPGVDTNALVFLVENVPPTAELQWVRCRARGAAFFAWIRSGMTSAVPSIDVSVRSLAEALRTGLSRGSVGRGTDGVPLGAVASVLRGIATGANDFYFLTAQQAAEIGIPHEFLRSAVGRTRDVDGAILTAARLAELDAEGRPTLLFSLDGRPIKAFPPSVRNYLAHGSALGLPSRALIASRRPWYKMETRVIPSFLFAYLGRRRVRFIRNDAGAVPLTGFLCVYPRTSDPEQIDRLWQVLSHDETIANLPLIGKSYGGGAIKVEPRALERLLLPMHLLAQHGVELPPAEQQFALIV